MNALVTIAADHVDMSALIARIDSARYWLETGDMRQALVLSEGAYDEAKAAHGFAARMKASESVIASTNAMVAEALEIGCLAKVALANEYDRAQAAGVVATRGRPKKVAGEDLLQLADFRLDKRVILDARKLRDAESKNPGVISRTIAVLSAEGVLPTKANLRAAIGTASASKEDRGKNFYQTPTVATVALLAHESFTSTIWEPACGFNAIGRVFEGQGYDVLLSDIEDRGTVSDAGDVQSVGDFLLSNPGAAGDGPDIVTNPPYGTDLNAFVAHALRVHKPRKLALLLNLNFLCGFADDDRNFVMDECPPSRVYAFKRRLPMMHREDYDGPKASSRMNTGWFVWERQEDGSYGDVTVLHRIDWADYADAEALDPGEGAHISPLSFAEAEEDFTRTTPRKTVDERVSENLDAAIAYATGLKWITAGELRRLIGVRPSTGDALVAALVERGMFVAPADENGRFWAPGVRGDMATSPARAIQPASAMPPVLSLPIIKDALHAGAPVAIGVSGGKDSQAAAIATFHHLDQLGHAGPRILVHSDLGVVEWSDSLPICRELADHLNVELMVVHRPAGDLMDRWEARWQSSARRYIDLSTVTLVPCWSTPAMRFCTSELKTKLIQSALKKHFKGQAIINVTGIRRAESSGRANATIAAASSDGRFIDWRPIVEWSEDEVFSAIDAEGLRLHPAYRQFGMSRVSCRFCIMSNIADLAAAAAQPESHGLLKRMVALECDSGFAFQGARWLGDVAPDLLGSELQGRVHLAKVKAARRVELERSITKPMLYVKGWPERVLTDSEADILADVRRQISDLYGFDAACLDRESIHQRYAELLAAKPPVVREVAA